MTQDEIYQELDISGANEDTKRSILGNILTTTEGRFVGIIDDLLSDDQLGEVQSLGSIDEVARWLQGNVPEAASIYEGVLRDHIAELKEQLAS